MDSLTIKAQSFELYISHNDIQKEVDRLADEINSTFAGREVVFMPVLNGAFMFFADLMKRIELDCTVEFVRYQSYEKTKSSGVAKALILPDLNKNTNPVIVVEDIVDTGTTLEQIKNDLSEKGLDLPYVCSLLVKPDKHLSPQNIDFFGFNIPDDFVLGYGLDYDGYGRNLKDLYKLK